MTTDAVVDVLHRAGHHSAVDTDRHGVEWKEEPVNADHAMIAYVLSCTGFCILLVIAIMIDGAKP